MTGVSLIICCHNSAEKLLPTIKHVNDLAVSSDIPWELIIVDNASTDNTYEIANQLLSDPLKNITKIVSEHRLGLKNARLRGIIESQYEFISFIDDDNWICQDWINIVFEIMSSSPEVGACGGGSNPAFDTVVPTWFESVHNGFAVGKQCQLTGYVPESRGYLWGAGLTIRRTAWNKLTSRGFRFMLTGRDGNKLTSGEDTELCFALRLCGWSLWYDERLQFVHYIPKERLDLHYLNHLYRAFGDASIILDQYRFFIECKPTSNISISKYYLINTLMAVFNLLKFTILSQLKKGGGISETKAILRKVCRAYEYGRTLTYLRAIPTFVKNLNNIRKLMS